MMPVKKIRYQRSILLLFKCLIIETCLYLQIEIVCWERIIFKPNINICGLFNGDLGSLTVLLYEIIKFSLVLIQMDYIKNMNSKEDYYEEF